MAIKIKVVFFYLFTSCMTITFSRRTPLHRFS
jgi:hypothetical protein